MNEQWQQSYPHVAEALAEEYRLLPREQAEQVVADALGGMSLQDAESFFGDIGRGLSRAASAAAPYVGPVLGGAASGAATGAVAGPWGALIGAGLGALTGGIQTATSRGPATRPAPTARPAAGVPAVGAAAVGAARAAGGGAGQAVPQLLAALGSPTVQRALLAMLMGSAGARAVPTRSGGSVPPAAVTGMLASLAHRAGEEWESVAPTTGWSLEAEGVDTASSYAQSGWLLAEVLPPAGPAGPAAVEQGEQVDDEGIDDESWLDEQYDEFEAFLDSWDEGEDELGEALPGWAVDLDEDDDLDQPSRSW